MTIDYYGEPLNLTDFFCALIEHEAMHRGQWKLYAALGGYKRSQARE